VIKKLLVLLLLLVTVLVLAVPAPALAWTGRSSQTAFVAVAQVAVVAPGDPQIQPLGNNWLVQTTTGEVVAGQILSAQKWPEVVGAGIVFQHQSKTYLNLLTLKITGTATGTVTVGPVDAQGNLTGVWMTGTYSAFIRGSFSLDANGQPTIYDRIFDTARWSLTGVGGPVAGITASGIGLASLTWMPVAVDDEGNPIYTLAGPMVLTGVYK